MEDIDHSLQPPTLVDDSAAFKIDNILQFWFGEKNEWRGSLWFKGVLYEGLPGHSPSASVVQSAGDARDAADTYIRETFGPLIDELVDPVTFQLTIEDKSPWLSTLTGRIALMTALDQFTRNAYRGTARMFRYDSLACSVARGLIKDAAFRELPSMHKLFVCVCLTHSEVLADVNAASVELLALVSASEAEAEAEPSLRPARIHSHEPIKDKKLAPVKKPTLANRFKTVLKQTETHFKILERFGRYPHRNYLLGRESTETELEYLCSTKHPTWVRSVGAFLPPGVTRSAASTVTAAEKTAVPKAAPPARKRVRILVLHGNKQNPKKFKKATNKAFQELDRFAQLHFLPAPQPYVPSGEVAEALDGIDTSTVYSSDRNLVWWNATDYVDTMEYHGLIESIQAVDDICREEGPFDGIFGFAQSASLAAIISKLQSQKAAEVQHCAFKFMLLVSGFPSRDVRPQFNMSRIEDARRGLEMPSFHTWGEADALISPSRSQALASCFKDAVLCPHPGGHFTGAVNLWPIKQMVDWIKGLMGVEETTTETVIKTIPNDEFDALHSFDEKFLLTLKHNEHLNVPGNTSVMWPYGLFHKEITMSQFWSDLFLEKQPLFETNGITDDDVASFVKECLRVAPLSRDLLDDLLLISFCVYPYETYSEINAKKRTVAQRKAVQGEVFYWMYRQLLQHVYFTETGPVQAAAAVGSLLELVVNSTRDWEPLLRIDLLVCTGCSRRFIDDGLSTVVAPIDLSPFQHCVHDAIVSIFAKRLFLDRNLLQVGTTETGGSGNSSYDEAVSNYLNLSVAGRLQPQKLTDMADLTTSLSISECSMHAPRIKSSIQKRTRLGSDIAEGLFFLRHQKNDTSTDLIWCRKEYSSLLQALSRTVEDIINSMSMEKLSLLKAKEYQSNLFDRYASFTEEEYQRRVVELPISRAVLYPEPEPVQLSTAEELSPLYQYLQERREPVLTPCAPADDDLVFTKGVVCPDGRLDLCKQAIGPDGVVSLFESLRADQDPCSGRGAVRHLLLGNNVCGDGLGEQVARHIAETNKLNATPAADESNDKVFTKGVVCSDGRLDLCKQAIGPDGVASLFESLRADQDPCSGRGAVRHLLLGNNVCGDGLGEQVARHIDTSGDMPRGVGLTTWYIAGNRLTVKGISPICDALATDKRVEQLWLKRNPLLPDGALKISTMLRLNNHLIVLDLVNTGILDAGAISIFRALGAPEDGADSAGDNINSTLRHLYLDGNGLTLESAKVACQYLSSGNCKLVTLSLGCNRLGDEGTKYICSGMSQDMSVQRLILASSGIGKHGAQYIAEMLRVNRTLLHLDLSMLKTTKALGELPNRIGVDGASALAGALESNNTLRSLLLFYNNIFQAGIEAFRVLLNKDTAAGAEGSNNSTLVKLELEQMGIPYNELSREDIRFCLRRNYLALSPSVKAIVDECINPAHLEEVASVYRVNGSYKSSVDPA